MWRGLEMGVRRDLGRAPPPPKIGKNMIFWRKIVIFHKVVLIMNIAEILQVER
jgi:hypothetical protein